MESRQADLVRAGVVVAHLRDRLRAAGAVFVQLAQALGSFLLQLVVARRLGLDGLAVFALLYGLVILGSGVITGLVGDSLTVLDRSRPGVRASLQRWTIASATGVACSGALVAPLLHASIDGATACWFGAAALLYMVEEVGRRLLMAVTRFWSVVAADVAGLVLALATLTWLTGRNGATLAECFASVATGQLAAVVVIVALLPSDERWLAPLAHRGVGAVWRYGAWRAAQQLFRPAVLTAVRVTSIAVAGATAYGRLEAARVVIAPAIHVVTGLTNQLFAGFARASDPDADLVVDTDRRVVPMVVMVVAIGAAALIGSDLWGALVTGEDTSLGTAGLAAWTAFAAATAGAAPYLALAAARGAQRHLTLIRLVESLVSIAAVAGFLALGSPVTVGPLVMAVVSAMAAVVVRSRLARWRASTATDVFPSATA